MANPLLLKAYCNVFDAFPVSLERVDPELQKRYLESNLLMKLAGEQPLLMQLFTKEQVMTNKTLMNELRYLTVDMCD